ncbi:MAG TPA: RNA polymerase-binding protein DksA [Albitalea sp.]|nr:RNA polymerase-binding protein DksA [Albitalea sp.]
MSTTPAKKATTKKPAAKKTPAAKASAKPAAKPAAKPTAKPTARPAPKPAAKPVSKPAGKPTAKPTAKPAAKAAAKPTAKPAAKAAPKVVPKPAAPAPAVKPHAKHANEPAPAPKPVAPAPAPRTTRATSRTLAAVPPAAPLPPPTSRFADRFAPPRPPTRQMNNLAVDTPKHAHKPDPKLANAWKTKAGKDLTEEELLAMPDSEYMNDKQLEFFRARLQALKDDLLSNAGETTEHLREDTSIVPDPADRATIEEEHALELRTRDRERKLLKKISQSLARIDAGDYGFCDETGEPIGLGRLIARPTATLSLEAQQRRELKQKMFGD